MASQAVLAHTFEAGGSLSSSPDWSTKPGLYRENLSGKKKKESGLLLHHLYCGYLIQTLGS